MPASKPQHALKKEPNWIVPGVRLGIALALGLAAGTGVGVAADGPLSARTPIVGGTTFYDFNVYRYLYWFFDLTLLVPAVVIVAFLVMARWGPLQGQPVGKPWPPTLVAEEPRAPVDHPGIEALIAAFGITLCVLIEMAAAGAVTGGGLLAATYLVAAAVVVRRSPAALAKMNSFAVAVLVALLVSVSASTTVRVASTGAVRHFSWMPAWLGLPAAAIAAGVVAWSLLERRSDPFRTERWAVGAVAAPILLFMLTAFLSGANIGFNGFDDAQRLVGARLVFGHGLWPWKQAFLLHGFLSDALYGQIGLSALSPDVWGSNAGLTFFVVPFALAIQVAFVAYFAKRNPLIALAGFVVIALRAYPEFVGDRYVLMPVTLILFDRVLSQGSRGRCWLFMGVAFLSSIVAPETTILMLGVFGTLVAAEAVHARRLSAARFPRTLRCLWIGVALVALWCIFLASVGALGGFVDYYRSTISGHQFWGAFKPMWSFTKDRLVTAEFVAPIALFLLTVWKVVVKVRRREPWETQEWVLVATATFVPLFYQVVLDRMDPGHVGEVFQAVTPLLLLWGIRAVESIERLIKERFLVTIAVIVVVPALFSGRVLFMGHVGTRFQITVPDPPIEQIPLGYTEPGAVNTGQILALGAALDRFSRTAPVFDFVNEMGVPYYLLGRTPGARFYHVESAQTPLAQELEIGDLKKSRPPVVIFFDNYFGLPYYDGITSMVRNYLVSQYLLDNYTPVVDVQGQLLMLRDDLLSKASPPARNLYFAVPSCNWGFTPNFFPPPSKSERAAAVPLSAAGTHLDRYQWVEIRSAEPFGRGTVTITDDTASSAHGIEAETLPGAGERLFIRVGSCAQWHGYSSAHLSVVTTTGTPTAIDVLP